MGRPNTSEDEKYSERAVIRFTKDEIDYYRRAALASGLTLSELVRRKMRGLKIPDSAELKVLGELRVIRNLLSKHGGLFKNLYNLNPTYKEETAAALREEIKMYGSVEKLIQSAGKKLNEAAKTVRT